MQLRTIPAYMCIPVQHGLEKPFCYFQAVPALKGCQDSHHSISTSLLPVETCDSTENGGGELADDDFFDENSNDCPDSVADIFVSPP